MGLRRLLWVWLWEVKILCVWIMGVTLVVWHRGNGRVLQTRGAIFVPLDGSRLPLSENPDHPLNYGIFRYKLYRCKRYKLSISKHDCRVVCLRLLLKWRHPILTFRWWEWGSSSTSSSTINICLAAGSRILAWNCHGTLEIGHLPINSL
jgi:hypothetical protein